MPPNRAANTQYSTTAVACSTIAACMATTAIAARLSHRTKGWPLFHFVRFPFKSNTSTAVPVQRRVYEVSATAELRNDILL